MDPSGKLIVATYNRSRPLDRLLGNVQRRFRRDRCSYVGEGQVDPGTLASVLAAQLAMMEAQLEALSPTEGVTFDVIPSPPGE